MRGLSLSLIFCFCLSSAANAQGAPTSKPSSLPHNIQELTKKAEQGDAMAELDLGVIYEKGQGVPQEYAEAVKWFRKAADHGDTDILPSLAYIYFYGGTGVPQNYAEAAKWDHKIINQSDFGPDVENAQAQLGEIYTKGEGMAQDYVQAYMWLNIAAASEYRRSRIQFHFLRNCRRANFCPATRRRCPCASR